MTHFKISLHILLFFIIIRGSRQCWGIGFEGIGPACWSVSWQLWICFLTSNLAFSKVSCFALVVLLLCGHSEGYMEAYYSFPWEIWFKSAPTWSGWKSFKEVKSFLVSVTGLSMSVPVHTICHPVRGWGRFNFIEGCRGGIKNAWKKHCCGSAFFWCRSGSDPNFYADADPDPDPGWHQNSADPHADPSPSFTPVGNLISVIALPLYNAVSFSSVPNMSYVFNILDSILKFLEKKST